MEGNKIKKTQVQAWKKISESGNLPHLLNCSKFFHKKTSPNFKEEGGKKGPKGLKILHVDFNSFLIIIVFVVLYCYFDWTIDLLTVITAYF